MDPTDNVYSSDPLAVQYDQTKGAPNITSGAAINPAPAYPYPGAAYSAQGQPYTLQGGQQAQYDQTTGAPIIASGAATDPPPAYPYQDPAYSAQGVQGSPQVQYGQPVMQPMYPGGIVTQQPMATPNLIIVQQPAPPNRSYIGYMVFAVIVTICCNVVCGAIAIIFAAVAMSAAYDDPQKADSMGKTSCGFSTVGIITFVILIVVLLA